MTWHVLQSSLALAIVTGTPLVFAGLGGLLAERSGVLNVGIEGVMLVGAVFGFVTAHNTGSLWAGLLAGCAAGGLFSVVFFGLPALKNRAPQLLIGFALWFIGAGLSAQIGNPYTETSLSFRARPTPLPLLHDIPYVGPILFDQHWVVYLGVFLALAAAFMLGRTRHGLNLRAVGEDPQASYAAGLNVIRWRLAYVAIGGVLQGLGGAVLSVVIVQAWRSEMTAGTGFVALALVTVAGWSPVRLLLTSYAFGVLLVLGSVGQAQEWPISSEFLRMVPYVLTVVVLVVRIWRERSRPGATRAPAGLGQTYAPGQR
ncbi:ABC transporter permease [Streptomyces hokutonensis]|uniref:ABC transporter permease n=1 Tax=Streptomyces hokutonensis TaxID=1306990 RepID=UPI0033DBB1DE